MQNQCMVLLCLAALSFGGLNCMVWRCCHSTLHERTWYLIVIAWFESGAFYSCNCSGIIISWQSRGRGRAQRGPRPLAWYELGCIRFQLITRGAFRFHSKPGLQAKGLLDVFFCVFFVIIFWYVPEESSLVFFCGFQGDSVSILVSFWLHFG